MSVVKRSATLTPPPALAVGRLLVLPPGFSRRVRLSRHLVAGRPRHAIGGPNCEYSQLVRHPWGDRASSEGAPTPLPTAALHLTVRPADRGVPSAVLSGKHRGPGIQTPRASNQRMRAITRGLVTQRNP